MKAGLDTGAEIDAASGHPKPSSRSFVPPAVEDLARLFPQLEILGLLGQGGMGAVYKARQPALDRMVALKILPARHGQESVSSERFNREPGALARVDHPNIVTVHDFGQVGGLFYFIMEYVDGANLRQLMRAGRVSPREAMQIVPQVCDALQYAHDEGVVHRDIKPENVLVDRKGRVKIADFGLAKVVGPEAPEERLTVEGQMMGTPHYMAPEQVERPQEVDHRADIYSVGVVFYELLTGELPLGKFQPPSRKVQVDVRLDEVVMRSLEKEPERRYQHVSEVKTDVQTIADSPSAPLAAAVDPAAESQTEGLQDGGQLRLGHLANMLRGETILFSQGLLWLMSCKSLPTYRWFFSLPPFWSGGLYVTNLRLLICTTFFGLRQDFSVWFPGRNDPNSQGDTLTGVTTGQSALFGDYLEIQSQAPRKQWFRGLALRLRFYLRQPELLRKTIEEARQQAAVKPPSPSGTDPASVGPRSATAGNAHARWGIGLLYLAAVVIVLLTIRALVISRSNEASRKPNSQISASGSAAASAPAAFDADKAVALFNDIEDFNHEWKAAVASTNLAAAQTGIRRLKRLLTEFNEAVRGSDYEFPPLIFNDIAKVQEALDAGDWDKARSLATVNEANRAAFRRIGERMVTLARRELATSASVPPVVIRTVPESGTSEVDPALTAIEVTFSQDMRDGCWAFCQTPGAPYPETTGKPRYLKDRRTCVLPVKLKPDTTYFIWLNQGQHDSFRDTANHPAVPYLLVFHTSATTGSGTKAPTKRAP